MITPTSYKILNKRTLKLETIQLLPPVLPPQAHVNEKTLITDEAKDQVDTHISKIDAIQNDIQHYSFINYFGKTKKFKQLTTPDELAKKIASMTEGTHVLDICSGTGAITKYIDAESIICVEKNKSLISNTTQIENCTTITGDITERNVINKLINFNKFNSIISNPPFSIAFEIMVFGKHMLKPDGKMILLLPSGFFETKTRIQLLKQLQGIKLVCVYPTGKWRYYEDKKTRTKRSSDSIYIFKSDNTNNPNTNISWKTNCKFLFN